MKKLIFVISIALFFPAAALASGEILINEIAWMGTLGSANDEWLELYNPTENEIDLTGWRLEAVDGSPKIMLSGKLNAHQYFLLERTSDETVPNIEANQIYTGSLSNTGEDLKLFDNNNNLINEIIATTGWPGGDNTTKNTLERSGENAWQTSAEPEGTPGAENSSGKETETNTEEESPATTTPEVSPESLPSSGNVIEIKSNVKKGEIIINEIFSNPSNSPRENEFIELKNISLTNINLKNFRLTNAAKQTYIIEEIGLAPGAFFVLNRSKTNLAIANEKEKITLYSDSNKIIDEVTLKSAAPVDLSWQKHHDKSSDENFCWEIPNAGKDNACKTYVAPIINISGPATGEIFETLIFDASDSFDKLNRPLEFFWEFGDGRRVSGEKVYQIYISPGSYEINLTIMAGNQASSTAIKKIKIKDSRQTVKETSTTSTPGSEIFQKPILDNLNYLPNIFISEFLADPKEEETINEFIEIFSNEPQTYDLSGFSITDSSAKTKPFILPPGTIIKPGQYLVFFRSQTKIALNNDGDIIKLLAPNQQIIDQAEYEKSKAGVSWVLDENFTWQESQTPSPGEINVLNVVEEKQAVTSSPKILGSNNIETENSDSERRSSSPQPTAKYIFTGISALFAIGAGLIYKFIKK